ncbi:M50 family metallopeptidase [Microbacterium azadirachtae]|uniref:M50 family metallopeptidase n=1 Tax=Microbacterium azadirachtae TaxID=582680 RepID=UPI00088F4713|nr:site-2 protease family protein [Microbacterium azadirachtae]SDL44462.1 Membrane-associated protease RseP, regulator of RpoE activity [Microbacterium azadirachtae]SEF74751.1 Membrane-associated protease RseP, regulator of RpoE activity [Microbacterium azadirachtae]SEF75603.1 Membrane-associated protease RseP, regulator of RpoE activity [Microbacterium azadirachtae]
MEILLYVGGLLFVLVGLGVSIALHELGHLVPAKLFGVHVGQYMIGFGPRLFSKRIGETEYGVKALPIGGFISMSGMYPPSPGEQEDAAQSRSRGAFRSLIQDARAANDETIDPERATRVFYLLPVWKRVVVMFGGPFMNLVLAIVVFTVLLSGIGVQQGTTTIASLSECVLPAGSTQTSCRSSDPVAPAAEAGVKPGDRIVSVDGTAVSTFAEASAIIQASPGKTIPLVVSRDGADVTLQLTPVAAQRQQVDGNGRPVVDDKGHPVVHTVGYAGVYAQLAYVKQPANAGFDQAMTNAGAVVQLIGNLPVRLWDVGVSLVAGTPRDPNGPLSVIGVGRIAGEVAAADAPLLNRFAVLLGLMGSLNIALFVFNLIPLLPLDGGHIVVALWDGLKRAWAKLFRRPPPAPVDATRLVPLTIVVAGLLIAMGALLLVADLFRPVTIG